MSQPKWTKHTPVKPGYYWVYSKDVSMVEVRTGPVYMFGHTWLFYEDVKKLNIYWMEIERPYIPAEVFND